MSQIGQGKRKRVANGETSRNASNLLINACSELEFVKALQDASETLGIIKVKEIFDRELRRQLVPIRCCLSMKEISINEQNYREAHFLAKYLMHRDYGIETCDTSCNGTDIFTIYIYSKIGESKSLIAKGYIFEDNGWFLRIEIVNEKVTSNKCKCCYHEDSEKAVVQVCSSSNGNLNTNCFRFFILFLIFIILQFSSVHDRNSVSY